MRNTHSIVLLQLEKLDLTFGRVYWFDMYLLAVVQGAVAVVCIKNCITKMNSFPQSEVFSVKGIEETCGNFCSALLQCNICVINS